MSDEGARLTLRNGSGTPHEVASLFLRWRVIASAAALADTLQIFGLPFRARLAQATPGMARSVPTFGASQANTGPKLMVT